MSLSWFCCYSFQIQEMFKKTYLTVAQSSVWCAVWRGEDCRKRSHSLVCANAEITHHTQSIQLNCPDDIYFTMNIKYSKTLSDHLSLLNDPLVDVWIWLKKPIRRQGRHRSWDGLNKLLQGTFLFLSLLSSTVTKHINDRVTGLWLLCNRWYRRIEVTVPQATEQRLQVFSVKRVSTHSSHLHCESLTQSSAPSWIRQFLTLLFYSRRSVVSAKKNRTDVRRVITLEQRKLFSLFCLLGD